MTSKKYSVSIHTFALIVILSMVAALVSPLWATGIRAQVGTPTPLTPAEGTVTTVDNHPPVAIPEFSWTAVQDASVYRIQFSQDIGFANKIEFTTPHTTFTPIAVGQFSDGLWYWRVRVDGPTVGNYSLIMSFTRQWASPGNSPTLTAPADNATIEFYDSPTFSWTPVVGAADYIFQIATSPGGFSTPILSEITLTTTIQPPSKRANGTYYWRVIPRDPAGREGIPSEVRAFDMGYNRVPTLIAPADNSTPTFTPTFQWTAVRGAEFYRMQYTSDPTCNFDAGQTTTINTRNTTYTPTNAFPNDVNYCWRVRAHSGQSISDWSPTWEFVKQWYIKAKPLTPTNLYQDVRFPFFSWTTVPGAETYRIEIDDSIDFNTPLEVGNTANPYYASLLFYTGGSQLNYWRVTPIDRNNNDGKFSDVFSYVSYYSSTVPHLVHPHYYFIPDDYPPPDTAVETNPHEDRTAPLPVFMWNHVHTPWPVGGRFAPAYRVQVSEDPLFGSTAWSYDTENTSAAPTLADNFTPQTGTDYYWRVCPLSGIGGSCLTTGPAPAPPTGGNPIPVRTAWSQIWRARFDLSQGLPPTSGSAPQLLRPAPASERVELTPLFEWYPYSGADSYQIQISQDPGFGSTVDDTTVAYPAYTPQQVLAERESGALDFGTYYWRVRARDNGNPISNWSAPWRFQIAASSQWQYSRLLGSANGEEVASDPDDVGDSNYELTRLYAVQSASGWHFGFDATATATNMTYVLYLDVDHADGSGASSDVKGYNVSTIPAHRPEFAIYVLQRGNGFSASDVQIYPWTGASWGTPQTLEAIGGALHSTASYVEIRVPNTAIGMDEDTGSYALSLFSVNETGGVVVDTVPSGNHPTLDRFTSVSDRLNLLMPPTNESGDPSTVPTVPPFFWEYTFEVPWAGILERIWLDAQYTTEISQHEIISSGPYYAPTSGDKRWDLQGDNTYYWRIRNKYIYNYTSQTLADGMQEDAVRAQTLQPLSPTREKYLFKELLGGSQGNAPTADYQFGAWSEGYRFERLGFTPDNLTTSVEFATPTFSWDIVEGAGQYDLQVDDDPNFGSLAINVNTAQTSYTPVATLPQGTYYWRVRARRHNNVSNDWSDSATFTLSLPKPSGLTPDDPTASSVVPAAPTLCWDPLIVSAQGNPVLAAWRYRVQVSRGDPTFSQVFDGTVTEQSCWTPTVGYPDGEYYWRVAMIDGNGRQGDYSDPAVFTKQYPVTTLISPTTGSGATGTPTFVWSVVDGAASYRLEVSQYPTFAPIYDAATTHNTRYTPIKVYQNPSTYYWRVAIVDKHGKLGPFNDATIILDPSGFANRIYLPTLVR